MKPLAIFDTGIGSYSVVRRIREKFPKQDIVYLADRASFPYGDKSRDELLACVSRTISYLEKNYAPHMIVVASNAPSVMVLEELREEVQTSLVGVFPPVEAAERLSKTGFVGVLGVKSLIESDAIRKFIEQQSKSKKVVAINASSLVQLVESGAFLKDSATTTREVSAFMAKLRHEHPQIDTVTLSSTHLPWLIDYFTAAAPDLTFVDPADDVVATISPNEGTGQIRCLVTESENYSAKGFGEILKTMNVELDPEIIQIKD